TSGALSPRWSIPIAEGRRVLSAMARSTVKFLKQQGQFNTRIAALVGCDRHTVARILAEPTDPPRRRRRDGSLESRRPALGSWVEAEIAATRVLGVAREECPASRN